MRRVTAGAGASKPSNVQMHAGMVPRHAATASTDASTALGRAVAQRDGLCQRNSKVRQARLCKHSELKLPWAVQAQRGQAAMGSASIARSGSPGLHAHAPCRGRAPLPASGLSCHLLCPSC